MRRLSKGPEPVGLVHSASALTTSYFRAVVDGLRTPSPWRRDDVRSALEQETDKKCVYCDSFILGITYSHIEHILPKAKRPDLVVAWKNLTIACPRCNTNKGDYLDVQFPLLNPYEDEPTDHFVFWGEMIYGHAGSDRGEQTILRLKLYRPDLADQRRRRIDYVSSLYTQWVKATEPLKESVAEMIRDDLAEGEYYGSVRAYLIYRDFPLVSDDPPGR